MSFENLAFESHTTLAEVWNGPRWAITVGCFRGNDAIHHVELALYRAKHPREWVEAVCKWLSIDWLVYYRGVVGADDPLLPPKFPRPEGVYWTPEMTGRFAQFETLYRLPWGDDPVKAQIFAVADDLVAEMGWAPPPGWRFYNYWTHPSGKVEENLPTLPELRARVAAGVYPTAEHAQAAAMYRPVTAFDEEALRLPSSQSADWIEELVRIHQRLLDRWRAQLADSLGDPRWIGGVAEAEAALAGRGPLLCLTGCWPHGAYLNPR